uniref:Uncharacterized protein n=1 Tax=Arundo donax TaxID=35708 RepID=A0A0A9AUI3_ARUDO
MEINLNSYLVQSLGSTNQVGRLMLLYINIFTEVISLSMVQSFLK